MDKCCQTRLCASGGCSAAEKAVPAAAYSIHENVLKPASPKEIPSRYHTHSQDPFWTIVPYPQALTMAGGRSPRRPTYLHVLEVPFHALLSSFKHSPLHLSRHPSAKDGLHPLEGLCSSYRGRLCGKEGTVTRGSRARTQVGTRGRTLLRERDKSTARAFYRGRPSCLCWGAD